jgi:class 3 adenylate cyclase
MPLACRQALVGGNPVRFNRFSQVILSALSPVKMWQSIFSTQYASADEEYFVQIAMGRRREASAETAIRLGILYDILMCIAVFAIDGIKLKQQLMTFHLLHMLLILPMFVSHSVVGPIVKNVGFKFFLPIGILAPALFYSWVLYFRDNSVMDRSFFLGVVHMYSLCTFTIMIHPGSRLERVFALFLMSTASSLAFSRHELMAVLATTNPLAMSAALLITFSIERQNRILAQKEFQLMIQAAPAKIVRQSALANNDLGAVFAPTHRHCVCISSDWRGYQALSAKVSSSELSKAIGAYYEMTDSLLSKVFPEGNYYTDWIADELFVVTFAKDASEEVGLINASLRFAQELILRKQEFIKNVNLPINIDVGVASGVALIGMMGPAGHRKATALGDVPGQARRYQEIGKQIRRKFGENDRVLFGYNSLLQITQPFDVKQFELEAGGKVRDVAEDRVFYLEPANKTQQDVA